MGAVRVRVFTAVVLLATSHLLTEATQIQSANDVSAKLAVRALRQEAGDGEMYCSHEEYMRELMSELNSSDVPQRCRDFYAGKYEDTLSEEESLINYFCDIECFRPLVTAITECYNAESAVGYQLLCSKNEDGTICGSLSQLSSEEEDLPYDKDALATYTACMDFLIGVNDSCSEACVTLLSALGDNYGCCANRIFVAIIHYQYYGRNETTPIRAQEMETLFELCGVEDGPGLCPFPVDLGDGATTGLSPVTDGATTVPSPVTDGATTLSSYVAPMLLLALLILRLSYD